MATIEELNQYRQRLMENVAQLNLDKHKFRSDDWSQLTNYHNYCLNILNNIVNVKTVEYSNPYNQSVDKLTGGTARPGFDSTDGSYLNPYGSQLKVIYNRDGTTKIVDQNGKSNRITQEWETQFDDNVINPPSYAYPPSNIWSTTQQLSSGSFLKPQ